MKQGVLGPGRVRLLLGKGLSCYRPRRAGGRERHCGCQPERCPLVIMKKREKDTPGLPDTTHCASSPGAQKG